MAQIKTNAMRILDSKKITYNVETYDIKDGKIDGISVAEKVRRGVNEVFKTLVTIGNNKDIYVFVIPVCEELDLKKAAKVSGDKKVEMIPVKDITKYTGYIKGGCSPIGQKKLYKTFIHKSAEDLDTMIVSGGKVGVQIELNPKDLINIIQGQFIDIIKNNSTNL